MNSKIIYPGGPCTCRPGRYVRYFVPRVPGLRATISCRANGAAKLQVETHDAPAGAVFALTVPDLGTRA